MKNNLKKVPKVVKDERIITIEEKKVIKDDIRSMIENRNREENREIKLKAKRIPMYEQNSLTFFDKDPNFAYRWVNDTYGRINSFQLAGWSFVEGDNSRTFSGKGREVENQSSSVMSRTVNSQGDNAPCRIAYLMKLPIELYEEDQKVKMAKIDADEKRIDPGGEIRKKQMMGTRINLLDNKK
jgi:hypothetical protein